MEWLAQMKSLKLKISILSGRTQDDFIRRRGQELWIYGRSGVIIWKINSEQIFILI